jgi:hypothetical protein
MNMKQIAEADTPLPENNWIHQSQQDRLEIIKKLSNHYAEMITAVEARDNGHVIVKLLKELNPESRGTLLLDYEFFLKDKIDNAITLWLEPLGDKSTLRQLRGIEVKV